MQIPGLIDPHVHMREPGDSHKEDWDTGTASALAGGYTLVLAMPNTQPPITNADDLALALNAAKGKARCDYAQFLGAGPDNADKLSSIAHQSAGLKMYLDQTYGPLRLDRIELWLNHFANWSSPLPIAVHAEGRSMAAVILLAALYDRRVHICHVSRRDEILILKAAKEKGLNVTCEVTPHHLFLSQDDIPDIGKGRSEVRPRLGTKEDRRALWENLDVIDCIATDHAPHTLGEKDGQDPPPGFPGLETTLPLLINAVHQKRLTLEDVIAKMYTQPKRIFKLPVQPETHTVVDEDTVWEIRALKTYTRCGWTPFDGWKVRGRVNRVVLRGQTVYQRGEVLAEPGYGRNIRS